MMLTDSPLPFTIKFTEKVIKNSMCHIKINPDKLQSMVALHSEKVQMKDIAARLDLSPAQVSKWLARVYDKGLDHWIEKVSGLTNYVKKQIIEPEPDEPVDFDNGCGYFDDTKIHLIYVNLGRENSYIGKRQSL